MGTPFDITKLDTVKINYLFDHIGMYDGKWVYFDETGDISGELFDTEEEARHELKRYVEYLETGKSATPPWDYDSLAEGHSG